MMKTRIMSMKLRIFCTVLLTAACLFSAGCRSTDDKKSQDLTAGKQHAQSLVLNAETKINYLLYLPNEYEQADKKWPLILFLHGAGERGTDMDLVRLYGLPKILENRQDFPFVVASPQCPGHLWWPMMTEPLGHFLDDLIAKYNIDPDRIYVTGLSMGGFGTWAMACAYPERFAAAAPICGGGEPYLANRLVNLPIWAFHGAKDDVIPLRQMQDMVDAVKKRGGNVRLTIYPEAKHDAWTETYNNEELYTWFLEHKRKP